MHVLLLGGGGFIGTNLVEHLHSVGGYEIVVVDLDRSKLDQLDLVEGVDYSFIQASFDADEARAAIPDADVVVDLVAFANPSLYVSNPLDVFRLNFMQNLDIVRDCIEHGKYLVQYSTCEVYGRPSGPEYVEDLSEMISGPVTKSRWIYAAGKELLERVIHAHGLAGELEYSIIRPFNFIGPRFDYLVDAGEMGGPRVFAHFMSSLLTGGPMYLVDGGLQRRSFTHIDDASRAFEAIITNPAGRNQIFNVGNPINDISIKDFARMMCDVHADLVGHRSTSDLVKVDGEEFYGAGYEDHTRVPPNIDKLRALGWSPRHDLDQTLRHAIGWHLAAMDELPSPTRQLLHSGKGN